MAERPSVHEQLADSLCSVLAVLDGEGLPYDSGPGIERATTQDLLVQVLGRSRKALRVYALARTGSLNVLALGMMGLFESTGEAGLLAKELERLPVHKAGFFANALTSNPLQALCDAVVGASSEAEAQ